MDFIIWGRESTHFRSADPCWAQRPSRPGPAAAKRLSGATKPSRAPLKTHYHLRSGAERRQMVTSYPEQENPNFPKRYDLPAREAGSFCDRFLQLRGFRAPPPLLSQERARCNGGMSP